MRLASHSTWIPWDDRPVCTGIGTWSSMLTVFQPSSGVPDVPKRPPSRSNVAAICCRVRANHEISGRAIQPRRTKTWTLPAVNWLCRGLLVRPDLYQHEIPNKASHRVSRVRTADFFLTEAPV